MPPTIVQQTVLKLSICITTFNRAAFIGATLESILTQVTNECEVVVLDGGSTDGTQQVASEYMRRFRRLRYIRQEMNNGIDRDYDRVLEFASGEYCWLMTDDDILKPGAVSAVLSALRQDLSLIIVNVESRDLTVSKVEQHRWIDIESDRVYEPEEMDRLFVDVGDALRYIGAIIIKRAIWFARERQRYYDSLFIYVGVIFQERLPGKAQVIAEPFIIYRSGNVHTFSPQRLDTEWVKWPSLVWSLALSESAKQKICSAEPWRSLQELLLCRGMGLYSLAQYRRLISPRLRSNREKLTPALVALLPGALVNALFVSYYFVSRRRYRGVWSPECMLQNLRESRFHLRNWRIFKRESLSLRQR